MRKIQRKIVGILMVSADGKIFLAKSDPANKGAYEEYWVIPGGGVEEGETNEQTAIRETLEETGIDISKYPLELINDSRTGESEKTLKTGERVLVHMNFIEFRVVINDRTPADIAVTLSHEHCEYRWFKPEELAHVKVSPPSFGLLKQLGYI